tara:strand:+ start:623 stop:1099 length:477 start_codon:yes stop_codon:yes gene_type:complete
MENSDLKKDFIQAMRGVASTVSVVSAKTDDIRHAMTAISVVSLSMEPPSMLVCVNKEASIHNILSVGSLFCINILSDKQESLSKVCSESDEGESRFEDIAWEEENGYVFNSNSSSNVFCECTNTIDHNTHTIFIAKVKRTLNNASGSPLVYMSGKYLK